jgi:hypothetical protein
MAKEVRYMLFSNEELYQALTLCLRSRSFELPKGFLKTIQIGETGTPAVALTYVCDKGGEIAFRFDNQEVLGALINYCHYFKIPLPSQGAKTLEIKDGSIGLLSTMNFKTRKSSPTGSRMTFDSTSPNGKSDKAKTVIIKVAPPKRQPAKRS